MPETAAPLWRAISSRWRTRYVEEPCLLGELGMTGLKNGRDYGADDEQRFLWLVKHFGLAIFTIRMTESKSV
jgi:hypothetical protein